MDHPLSCLSPNLLEVGFQKHHLSLNAPGRLDHCYLTRLDFSLMALVLAKAIVITEKKTQLQSKRQVQ